MESRAGERFTLKILEALKQCTVIAVFLGPLGRGPWQNEEVDNAINTRAKDGVRIIPVLLPGAAESVAEGLLQNRTWVKFSQSLEDEDAFRRLIAGIGASPPVLKAFKLPGSVPTVARIADWPRSMSTIGSSSSGARG